MIDNSTTIKPLVDTLSVSTAVATLLGWLPHIAALLSIIWMVIRIWETETVRKVVNSLEEYKAKALIRTAKTEAKALVEIAKDVAIELKHQEKDH